MVGPGLQSRELTDSDIEFVVGVAAPEATDREQLRRLAKEDREFREALVGDDNVFQRVADDEEAFLKVSPFLYFEVLLRRALKELETATHTVERTGNQSIAVFDTENVVGLLSRPGVVEYLAGMLASFTRTESYVVPVHVRRGIRRRVRYSDMDIDSLMRLCADADETDRLRFYKRIADVCLFVSGLFPGHASGRAATARPGSLRGHRTRRSLEDYELEGRRFYGLAEEHPAAHALELSGVFGLLREYFVAARKPLVFIASQYLHSRTHRLFGVVAQ